MSTKRANGGIDAPGRQVEWEFIKTGEFSRNHLIWRFWYDVGPVSFRRRVEQIVVTLPDGRTFNGEKTDVPLEKVLT